MKTNIGKIDRTIRILVAVAIVGLYSTGLISGTVALLLLILSGIFIATSIVSFCPLYWPFGISTKGKESTK